MYEHTLLDILVQGQLLYPVTCPVCTSQLFDKCACVAPLIAATEHEKSEKAGIHLTVVVHDCFFET